MQQVFTTATVAVQPKSKKELAAEYGVHRNTMTAWCQQVGITTHGRLTVQQLVQLYQHYGLPGEYALQLQ